MTSDQAPQFSTAEFEPELKDSHGLLLRGLLFGFGGALLGIAIYAGVGIATGFEIGVVSLAVGFIVAKAILFGSRGRTGRRYQLAAALLTYFAVSMSAVPVGLHYMFTQADLEAAAATTDTAGRTIEPGVTPQPQASAAETTPGEADVEPISMASLAGLLFWAGISSPFYQLGEGTGGIISLIILAVGIRIAWTMTADRGEQTQQTVTQALGGGTSDDPPTSLNIGR